MNLIGGEDVGLPLSGEYLEQNPNVLNLKARDYERLPKIGDYYDAENDVFVDYEEWIAENPVEVTPSAGALTSDELAELRRLISQLPTVIAQMNEMIATFKIAGI